MDLPLDIPFELCDKIFQYLNPADLLNCLLVSREWNSFITQSRRLMKKFTLIVNHESVIGNRNYQNARLENLHCEHIVHCLESLPEGIRCLELDKCFLFKEQIDIHSKLLNLQHLEELTLANVTASLIHVLENSCRELKILNVYHLDDQRNEGCLQNLLRVNHSLHEINIYLDSKCNIFAFDLTEITTFQLKSITISCKCNFEVNEMTLLNIERFLKHQGATLKTISLINVASYSLLNSIWNHLKATERLYFFTGEAFSNEKANLEALDLREFELHVLSPLPVDIRDLLPYLEKVPRVQSLGVWNLNRDVIEFAAFHLKYLKQLVCATMDDDCDNFHKQLKAKNGKINTDFVIHRYL